MTSRTNGLRGRVRLAAALLGAAIALPGLALAGHYQCGPAPAPECPIFDPAFDGGPQVTFTNAASGFTFRYTQQDETMPAVAVDYFLPNGWQLAVNSIRPAQISEGPNIGMPATQCSEVYIGEENDADTAPATLGRAENLAGGVGMTGEIDRTRGREPTFDPFNEPPVLWGYRNTGNGIRPSFAFVRWDAATETADLCLYLFTTNVAVDHTDDTGLFAVEGNFRHAREHIIPVTIQRIAADPTFDWRIHFDLTSVYNDHWLAEQNVSLLQHLLYAESLSGGNWNTNPLTSALERIVFSRTPATPGTYTFRGDFFRCAIAMDTASANGCADGPDAGTDGDLVSVTRSRLVDITPPPNHLVREYGRVAGVGNATGAVQAGVPTGFSLVRNSTTATFKFNQTPGVVPVKGYELAIARPGDQVNQRVEYMITNPSVAGFDATVCGATGGDPGCVKSVSFPAGTMGPRSLTGDEKYDVSLTTIYTDGSRSDRRCDNGAPLGVTCPPTTPAIRVAEASAAERARGEDNGVSKWQVYITPLDLPVAYLQNSTVTRTGSSTGGYMAPRYLSISNFLTKVNRFVDWNALGREVVRSAPSLLIIGDNANGGLISMADPGIAGKAERWRVDILGGPPGSGARGAYVTYRAEGLPELPPSGMPSAFTEAFQGTRLA